MQNRYNIFIDYEADTLNIIKSPSRTPVKSIEGKYGIEFRKDINGNIVEFVIPEPDILFGVDIECIENFLLVKK